MRFMGQKIKCAIIAHFIFYCIGGKSYVLFTTTWTNLLYQA